MSTELTLDPQFNPQSENKIQKSTKEPWNKGKLMGQKPPLKLKEVWEIRIRLQLGKRLRELALFNLAIPAQASGKNLTRPPMPSVARIRPRFATMHNSLPVLCPSRLPK